MKDWSTLLFFDKEGNNLNFDYEDNVWKGNIYMSKVSVGLYSVSQIYILQEKDKLNNGNSICVYPEYHSDEPDKFIIEWDPTNTFVDEITLFNFDTHYKKIDTSSLNYKINDGPDLNQLAVNVFDECEVPLYKEETDSSEVLQLNILFQPNKDDKATTYRRTLFINYDNKRIAEITVYAESIEEDERMKVLCENLGYNIKKEDEYIFEESELEEPETNIDFLNQKRKEILLEGPNIYPYLGSYRALINAIKYFGYDDVYIAEFWRNLNPNSQFYKKDFRTSKYRLDKAETIKVNSIPVSIPNKDYRKINRVALVYRINDLKDNYTINNSGFTRPIVEENFHYTIEEIIIKLFGLKKKLDNEFMPITSKITDVIGEGDYFTAPLLKNFISSNRLDDIIEGIDVDFEAYPENIVYITDDRKFNHYLENKYNAKRINVLNESLNEDSINNFNTSIEDLDNYYNGSIKDLLDTSIGGSINTNFKTFDYNMKNSELVSEFKTFFKQNGYGEFDKVDSDMSFLKDENYKTYNFTGPINNADDNRIPISAKVILHNSTFDNVLKFKEADFNFNEVSNLTKFGDFKLDFCYHIKWIVKYNKDGNIKKDWVKEVEGDIKEYNDFYVELPYVGTYSVFMSITNLFNTSSSRILNSFIEVKPYNLEIDGIYQDYNKSSLTVNPYSDEIRQLMSEITSARINDAIEINYSDETQNSVTKLSLWQQNGKVSDDIQPFNTNFNQKNNILKFGNLSKAMTNISPMSLTQFKIPVLFLNKDNNSIKPNDTTSGDYLNASKLVELNSNFLLPLYNGSSSILRDSIELVKGNIINTFNLGNYCGDDNKKKGEKGIANLLNALNNSKEPLISMFHYSLMNAAIDDTDNLKPNRLLPIKGFTFQQDATSQETYFFIQATSKYQSNCSNLDKVRLINNNYIDYIEIDNKGNKKFHENTNFVEQYMINLFNISNQNKIGNALRKYNSLLNINSSQITFNNSSVINYAFCIDIVTFLRNKGLIKDVDYKLFKIGKFSIPEENISINYSDFIPGNPNLETLRYIRNAVKVFSYTWVIFSCDIAKVLGKKNIKWELYKIVENKSTNKVQETPGPDITYNHRYFPILLIEDGTYKIKCTCEDSNGNTYSFERTLIAVTSDMRAIK